MIGITMFCNIIMPFNDREMLQHFLNVFRHITYNWYTWFGLNTFMKFEILTKAITGILCKLKFKRKIKNYYIYTIIKHFQLKLKGLPLNFSISD